MNLLRVYCGVYRITGIVLDPGMGLKLPETIPKTTPASTGQESSCNSVFSLLEIQYWLCRDREEKRESRGRGREKRERQRERERAGRGRRGRGKRRGEGERERGRQKY